MLGERSSVLMRGGIWRSLVVVATIGITSLGCVGGSPQPEQVPLEGLVADHGAHDGSTVVTEGIVQTYDEPRHYWIEDAEQHRVELFPPERVEDFVGLRVRVTGRFTFRDDRGRGIDVDELDVVDEPPSARSTSRAPPTAAAGRADREPRPEALSEEARRAPVGVGAVDGAN